MKIRTFYDKSTANDVEIVVGESMTVPDQSLSVRDILTRFTRGQIVIPPMEIGDDDDIDSPLVDFEDPTDALEAMEYGNDLLQQIAPSGTNEPQQPDTHTVAQISTDENPHD